jgi:hypothetical protein
MRFKDILLSDAGKFGAAATVKAVLKGETTQQVKLTGYISQRISHCGADSVDCGKPCTQCLTGTNDYPVMEIGEAGVQAFQVLSDGGLPPTTFNQTGASGKFTTVVGEIVDPKCFFGAMNPGEGKTHLSCAARCLSGGIMPVLKWQELDGEHFAVLVGSPGEAINAKASRFTGMRVKVYGQRSRMDNWELIQVMGLEEAWSIIR